MRSRKAIINSSMSLLLELTTVFSGIILPRLILTAYGSDYNGISASVTQFLAIITLLRSGIGGVTRASLYEPLAHNNIEKVSQIIRATELFLRKIALLFGVGLVIFAAVYQFIVINEFDWIFSFTLILILGTSVFFQYFFGLAYRILLLADQKSYIDSVFSIITVLTNLFISMLLIRAGSSFHTVKLATAGINSIIPLLIYIYIRKKYAIQKNIVPDMSAIRQRWDAFAQQVANYINDNTDMVILAVFIGVKEVSVYSVYAMVTIGIKTIITSITNGLDSAFGNMLAKKQTNLLEQNFKIYELLNNSISTILFSCTFVLLLPFVSLYTKGVTDADYYRPLFCALIVAAEYAYCLRLPYKSLTYAAGHYKQTKNSAWAEAIINIIVSIVLVNFIGMPGVALGTLMAVSYRTFSFAIYLSKKILKRRIVVYVKNIFIFVIAFIIIVSIAEVIVPKTIESIQNWITYAAVTMLLSCVVILFVSFIFYRFDLICMLEILKRNFLKRRG